MSLMIESMESRTLLTASATVITDDFVALKAAGTQAKADLTAALAAVAADVKALKTAVAGVKLTPAERKPLLTFERAEVVAAAKYRLKIETLLGTGALDEVRLAQIVARDLEASTPGGVLAARVQLAIKRLENVFSTTVVSAVEANASTTVTTLDTDLNAVAAAIPSTQTAVTTIETALAGDLTTLSNDATAIQNAVTQLATDLG